MVFEKELEELGFIFQDDLPVNIVAYKELTEKLTLYFCGEYGWILSDMAEDITIESFTVNKLKMFINSLT